VKRTSLSLSVGIEKVSFGVNFNYYEMNLIRRGDFSYYKSDWYERMYWDKEDFKGNGADIDIGILLKPESGEEGGSFGIMFSSGSKVVGEGNGEYYYLNSDSLKKDSLYSMSKFKREIVMPFTLKFGVNIYKKNFSLGGEWVVFREEVKVYPIPGVWPLPPKYLLPDEFKIPYIRVGAEILLPKSFSVRFGGYGYLEKEPTVFTIGAGFKIKKIAFDISVEKTMAYSNDEGMVRGTLGVSYGSGKKFIPY